MTDTPPPSSAAPVDCIRIGKCLSPHGIQGGVKLYVLGDAAQLTGLKQVYIASRGWLRLQRLEQHAAAVVLFLAGINSRDAALTLRDLPVYARESDLPPLEEGCYYYHQLRGLRVIDATGAQVAQVDDVLDGGHQDLLVISNIYGQSFLPLQAPYVQIVGPSHHPTHVSLTPEAPEGLLPQAQERAEPQGTQVQQQDEHPPTDAQATQHDPT